MGIPRGSARLLLDEAQRRPFSGSVLELGKMFVFFGPDELERWASMHGVELRQTPVAASHDERLAAAGCMDDRSFFRRLGFDEVLSSDATRWEGADLVLDLDEPVPEELHGRFDVVFEGGTLQHVFDLPRALENIHLMLKPGGRVIHGDVPSNNHVDHGFYMFSPTFFHDYYRANGYEIETLRVFDLVSFWVGPRLDSTPWKIYDYEPGCLDHLAFGRAGNRQMGIFVVATKTDDSTGGVVPRQRLYEEIWSAEGEREPDAGNRPAPPDAPSGPLHVLRRRWKLLRERLRRLGPKAMPPVVARY